MNEEIDESEFYHQDFTTASEWEIFIARMEEIIHEWNIENKKGESEIIKNGSWIIKSENLPFADTDFTITLYENENKVNDLEQSDKPKSPIDNSHNLAMKDVNNDFADKCLADWYGLQEYIVLSPTSKTGIVSESKIKILLSSITIAVANTNTTLPIFVQIREKWQRCYLGVYESNGIRTNFEMVHLRKGPQHCQYLTGLIDLFKTKIMAPVNLEPILVSVQHNYLIRDFGVFEWKFNDNDDIKMRLEIGTTVDPVESLELKTSWCDLPDNLIIDSENYSNFNSKTAQKWTIFVNFTQEPVCMLAECLTEFEHLIENDATMYDLLGDFAAAPVVDEQNPFDVLTESKVPTISTVIKRATRGSITGTKARKGVAPLCEEILVPLLYFLFPDADEELRFPYNLQQDDDDNQAKYKNMKTCKIDSLVWRMSIVLSQTLQRLGGTRCMAHIWFEFVQEMRYRWEKGITIPGLSEGFPDPRTCLLHQKLQMLNCCIQRKKAREDLAAQRNQQHASASNNDGGSSDEEFFDCDLDEKHSLWNQPVGRLGKYENLKLLKTGDQLYIPITQDPVPKTEDQLEEDTNILLKLGSDAQGSELRARMMSASLLSDMESFKAANPGSILEDFIRWYSPRDWIEDDGVDEFGQRCGHLSSRMLISDNTWMETWKSAKPVPASRQKRLFDDTREAEKVLHFLDACTMRQIASMLFPILAQAAIYRLSSERNELPFLDVDGMTGLIKNVERLSRDGNILNQRRCEVFTHDLAALELELCQARSLQHKFDNLDVEAGVNSLISQMMKGREVELVERDKVSGRLMEMLSEQCFPLIDRDCGVDDDWKFPEPAEREFVMRVCAHRPAAYSIKSMQFLRAILTRNDFRLIGAFTDDIVFF